MNISSNFGFINNSAITNNSPITQASSAPSMPSTSPTISEEQSSDIQDAFSMSSDIEVTSNIPSNIKQAISTDNIQTTSSIQPVNEEIKTIDSVIPSISSSAETAASTAGSMIPGPSGGIFSSIKNAISSISEKIKKFINSDEDTTAVSDKIKNFISPEKITPDEDTKAMTKAFGSLTAITGGLSENEAEALLQQSGERNLNNTLEEMRDLRYLQRPAVANSGMTLAEKTALFAYTGDAYASLNTALRTHDTEKLEQMRPLIDNTVAALDKLPPYEGKTVYRGAEMPQTFFDEHKPGAKVTYSAFTSTSTKALPGFKGNTAISIDCAGDRSSGKDIQKFSKFEYENEILFPPDSEFIVISHTVKDGKHFIHMKEIPKQA